MWHWEKTSKNPNTDKKRILHKLWVLPLICINYYKQFKIIWATVSSLPTSLSATQLKQKKSPHFTSNTHINIWVDASAAVPVPVAQTWLEADWKHATRSQHSAGGWRGREGNAASKFQRPDRAASPAALARGLGKPSQEDRNKPEPRVAA